VINDIGQMDRAEIEHDFDADWYVRRYPDVAAALRVGKIQSAIQHYIQHGQMEGRRPKPAPTDARALVPLLISSAGRSGSTLLMKILLTHPSIIGGNQYPYEVRPASYFANAFHVLTSRADTFGVQIRDTFDSQPGMLTVNPFYHADFQNVTSNPDFFEKFYKGVVLSEMTLAFQAVIETFYRQLSSDQTRVSAQYFIEKVDATRVSRIAFRGLYRKIREILLIRDLRDVVCSFRVFFKDHPYQSLVDHLASVGNILSNININNKRDSIIIKYEDLFTERDQILTKIANFLELENVWSQDFEAEEKMHGIHGTTNSPFESIGRWKNELTPDEREECNEKFANFLREFAYT
jgi:hypothetical protein